jgi:hypothetical protein
MPTKRAKELRHQAVEIKKQCTETMRRSQVILAHSKLLQQALKSSITARAAGAAGAR